MTVTSRTPRCAILDLPVSVAGSHRHQRHFSHTERPLCAPQPSHQAEPLGLNHCRADCTQHTPPSIPEETGSRVQILNLLFLSSLFFFFSQMLGVSACMQMRQQGCMHTDMHSALLSGDSAALFTRLNARCLARRRSNAAAASRLDRRLWWRAAASEL